jgi:predicted permease
MIAGVMAIVGLVLLVAAANVANLILAHAVSRQREIAVRLAIGAARLRIVRQLIVEALMLSVAAGLVAILIAEWAMRVLYTIGVSMAPFPWTIALNLEPDARVFGYTLALATLGGFVLGLVPALQTSSPEIVRALHGESTIGAARIRGSRLRHGLVIVEVAASLVLLVAAGLLLRGLQSARALDLGFTPAGVIYADYDLRALGYTKERAEAFNRALGDRAAAMPGTKSVGFTSHVPLHGGVRRTSVRLLDARGVAPVTTMVTTVTPGYFDTLRIPIVEGRNFDRDDVQAHVIISDGLARRFWPGEPAIGKGIQGTGWAVPRTVVGVARDASSAAIWRDKEMAIYLPAEETTTDSRDVRLIVRTAASVPSTAASLKAYAASLDADLRFEAAPLDGLLRLWLLPSRVAAGSAAALAGMALLLACIGLYGVLSFTVSQRMREIGVRMALGADARRVVLLVIRDGWRMVAKGLAAGAACSFVAAPLLGRLLFDVSAFDPLTMVGVPLLLAAVALVACYVPARRASRLEPLTVLRVD